MQTRPIPGSSLTPSVLCMGTGDFGAGLDRAASFALLDAFFEGGGTFLDSAKVYSDWIPGETSRSEKTVGAWIKARGNRHQVVVATKCAHPDLASMHIPRMSPAEIVSDLDASLSHLGVETIDVYYLHRDDPSRPVEEIIDTLEAQAKAGKIRTYACSNWRPGRIRAARAYAAARGFAGFGVDQPLWNLAKVEMSTVADQTLAVMDGDLWTFHQQTGMACAPYSSQANGFFQKLETGLEERLVPSQQAMYLTDANRARAARLAELKARTGLTTTQVVLGYLLSQPFPTFPIFSVRGMAQLQDTLTAADVRLAPEDLRFLEGQSQEM